MMLPEWRRAKCQAGRADERTIPHTFYRLLELVLAYTLYRLLELVLTYTLYRHLELVLA